ncbi:hypothetical protein Sjap_003963 [Stephania japonica]|uniref:Uncharacterized protein n=1 Tax=Stephania japonica TaxID=461633 RepID=A0AAP0K3K0_9MAGN
MMLQLFLTSKENSFLMDLAYIVEVVSLLDEFTNDLLYLRERSCLPSFIESVLLANGAESDRDLGVLEKIWTGYSASEFVWWMSKYQ